MKRVYSREPAPIPLPEPTHVRFGRCERGEHRYCEAAWSNVKTGQVMQVCSCACHRKTHAEGDS